MPIINWDFMLDPWLISVLLIGFVVMSVVTIIWGIRAHRFKIAAGMEELIDRTAVVKVNLEPQGTVFVDGERWAAISESGPVKAGEEVIITKVDSLKLYVRKKEEK
ncbi:MAG: NfeD family protein [Dehalococcoidales bacterium]|nr:NfeD family protein [Dehalococcoidales bacterium]